MIIEGLGSVSFVNFIKNSNPVGPDGKIKPETGSIEIPGNKVGDLTPQTKAAREFLKNW